MKELSNTKLNSNKRRDYYRSPKGLTTYFWGAIRANSRNRGHSEPVFTKQELADWLLAQGLEAKIVAWSQANWDSSMKPSIDRIDSEVPYTLSNMRLVTWHENNQAAYIERKTKRSTKQAVRVVQLTLSGEPVAEYISVAQAARETGFCRTHINSCVNGKYPEAHGYKWEKMSVQHKAA